MTLSLQWAGLLMELAQSAFEPSLAAVLRCRSRSEVEGSDGPTIVLAVSIDLPLPVDHQSFATRLSQIVSRPVGSLTEVQSSTSLRSTMPRSYRPSASSFSSPTACLGLYLSQSPLHDLLLATETDYDSHELET